MSSWTPNNGVKAASGRSFQKQSVKPIGQATKKSHLSTRMKADDSKAVLMSDSKLGSGISSK